MQVDRATRRKDRHLDWRIAGSPGRIERPDGLFGVGLAPAEDSHDAGEQHLAGHAGRESATNIALEHRSEFSRRTGQQHNDLIAVFDPQAWGRAVDVVEHDCAVGHHRLTAIDLGHREVATRKTRPDGLRDRGVLTQRPLQHVGHDIARQVVVGGPEPTTQDHHINPFQGAAENGGEIRVSIADDRFGPDVDAELIQRLGNRQRVGVDTGRRQQFRADCDDLGRLQRAHHAVPSAGNSHSAPRRSRFP